jgi:hypothetical protein
MLDQQVMLSAMLPRGRYMLGSMLRKDCRHHAMPLKQQRNMISTRPTMQYQKTLRAPRGKQPSYVVLKGNQFPRENSELMLSLSKMQNSAENIRKTRENKEERGT